MSLKWPLAVGTCPAGVATELLFEASEGDTQWLIVLRVLTPGEEKKAVLTSACCCAAMVTVLHNDDLGWLVL